jgi:hypothetical protein
LVERRFVVRSFEFSGHVSILFHFHRLLRQTARLLGKPELETLKIVHVTPSKRATPPPPIHLFPSRSLAIVNTVLLGT